jgi:hypothetical protein
MTELGWSTQSTRPGSCPVGAWKGQKPLGVSGKRQARFLRAAYRCLAADPFAGPAFWFGLQDIRGTQYAGGYGLYRLNGEGKRSAKAFKALGRGISARRGCGGAVDRTPPAIRVAEPADGRRFSGKLSVRVSAADNKGGTGLQRIYLAADGEHVRTWGGTGGSIDPWWATEKWKPGPHTLTFKVRDNALNETTVSVTVVKVRGG